MGAHDQMAQYTLKVDWRHDRIKAVYDVLDRNLRDATDLPVLFASARDKQDMVEIGATLKLHLSPEQLDELQLTLAVTVRELSAALFDILAYRQTAGQ
jgi:hypothetical protein